MTAGSARLRPRHRRTRGPVALLILTCLAILSLTFLVGVLVGRQWGRTHPQAAEVEKGKRAPLAARQALDDRELRRPLQIQEKLTFYHTLTAPLPSAQRPTPAPRDPKAGVNDADAGHTDSAKREDAARAGAPDGRLPAQSWTVQVAAYRSADSAATLQGSLAASGYDAYVVPSPGEDGVVRYRVRVGNYPSRSEAEKIAERLRSERAVASFVVPR